MAVIWRDCTHLTRFFVRLFRIMKSKKKQIVTEFTFPRIEDETALRSLNRFSLMAFCDALNAQETVITSTWKYDFLFFILVKLKKLKKKQIQWKKNNSEKVKWKLTKWHFQKWTDDFFIYSDIIKFSIEWN